MEALELLQRLISDPTERIRYKQNPEAYLSSRGLDEKARKLFSDTLNQCSPRQVATVMTLTASLNSDLTQEIDLEGEAVTLYSDEHFFIDKGTTGSGLLLEGSYADINAKKFIFKLIYTDPKTSHKQVVTIETKEKPPQYSCKDVIVNVTIVVEKWCRTVTKITFTTEQAAEKAENLGTDTIDRDVKAYGSNSPK